MEFTIQSISPTGGMVPTSVLRVDAARPVARSTRPRKARRWLRTREIERLQVHNLQLDIITLQSEIQRLELARTLLQARVLNRRDDADGYCFKLMREYFGVLRHGLGDQASQDTRGRSFLDAILHPDVKKGRLRGVDQFVTMLARYTQAFGPVIHEFVAAEVHADRQDRDGGDGLIALRVTSRYQTSVVENTFDIIFPRASPSLRDELVGRPVSGVGVFDVVFDSNSRRVVSFDMDFGFVAVFARLLPDPAKLASLLSNALVTPDCCIGDLSDFNLTEDDPPVRSPGRSLSIQELLNED